MEKNYVVKFKNEAGTCTHYETKIYSVSSQLEALTQAMVGFVDKNSTGRSDDMTNKEMKDCCVHIGPFGWDE